MRLRDLKELVDGTSDAAFVITTDGSIQLWNREAECLLEHGAAQALERHCCELLRGCGPTGEIICCEDCVILQKAREGETAPAFYMEIQPRTEKRWISVSTCVFARHNPALVLHLAHDVGEQHRVAMLTREFLSRIASLSGEAVEQMMVQPPSPHYSLTAQEKQVLRLLTDCRSTRAIADELGISAVTVRNHVEHILQKLSAHSRTEAVMRVIREKLL